MQPDFLVDLNPEQREVAVCRTHCLATACPGAGKTKTLAAKAAFLLADGQSCVAAVTFTRDSAMELRDRILAITGNEAKPRLVVGTFHSLDLLMAFPQARKSAMGEQIFKNAKGFAGKPWEIIEEGARRAIVMRAITDSGAALELDEATTVIEELKAQPGSSNDQTHKDLVKSYQAILARHGQIDFQDILLRVNQGLRDRSVSPLQVQYLLVDEFQDTDPIQYEWVAAHGRAGVALTCVGDDDQSLYGWRNAMGYEGMERFAQEFGSVRVTLGANYRCRQEVLMSAGNVIKNNTARIYKNLVAAKGPGGFVEWERFDSRDLEAEACVTAAAAALRDNHSFAVLARTNKRLDNVEAELIKRNLPYRRTGGQSLFDRPEVALFGTTLGLLEKQTSKGVDHVLGWAGLSETDLQAIHQVFGQSIRVGAKADFANAGISDEGLAMWRSFANTYSRWSEIASMGHYSLVMAGVHDWLSGFAPDPQSQNYLDAAAKVFDPGTGTIAQRLQVIRDAARSRKSAQDKHDGKPFVLLMTAHGSKGLEWDQVWLVGAEEDTLPDKNGSLEEERRLAYVAMTRAREKLWVSAGGKRAISRFVVESLIERAPQGKYKTTNQPAADQNAS
jgi:superfamily I DNA/RNA helicase